MTTTPSTVETSAAEADTPSVLECLRALARRTEDGTPSLAAEDRRRIGNELVFGADGTLLVVDPATGAPIYTTPMTKISRDGFYGAVASL